MSNMKLPNGYGGVFKLSGNRRKPWCVRKTSTRYIDESGKLIQKYTNIGYYETRELALNALSNYNQNPYDMDAVNITFAEVYNKWSDEHFKKVSTSNIQGYKASYMLCKSLYNMKFAEIKRNHLQAVVDTCGKNYPTLRKLKVLFNMMFKFAMQNDVCGKDYSDYVDIAQYRDKNPNKYDRKPFTDDDIKKLWKWSKTSEYIGVMLMLIYSGVRVSELLDLKKENVHLKERYFDVIASKTKAGIRSVPISKKVQPFFEYWMNQEGEYLITTPEGSHFQYRNYYDSYWMVYIKQIDLSADFTPHCTRHTCISLLTRAGVNDKVIKKIVGHKGQGVTEIVYTHFEIKQLLEAIDKI